MNIQGIERYSAISTYSKNKTNSTEKTGKNDETDRIEISSFGKRISSYLSDLDIDNSKKLMDIKDKIENGTYNIDEGITAKSILNSIKENKL